MEEYFDISSQLLISNKNDDDIFMNTISLLDGSMEDERRINILQPNYNPLDFKERYVTKIPQCMIKKSIGCFGLSILQETTFETKDKRWTKIHFNIHTPLKIVYPATSSSMSL